MNHRDTEDTEKNDRQFVLQEESTENYDRNCRYSATSCLNGFFSVSSVSLWLILLRKSVFE